MSSFVFSLDDERGRDQQRRPDTPSCGDNIALVSQIYRFSISKTGLPSRRASAGQCFRVESKRWCQRVRPA